MYKTPGGTSSSTNTYVQIIRSRFRTSHPIAHTRIGELRHGNQVNIRGQSTLERRSIFPPQYTLPSSPFLLPNPVQIDHVHLQNEMPIRSWKLLARGKFTSTITLIIHLGCKTCPGRRRKRKFYKPGTHHHLPQLVF